MKIAILGYGVVGSGAYEVAKTADNIEVKRVLHRRAVAELGDIVTTDYDDIINDREIELVAECIGGLHPAYEYVAAAIKSGKHVVTPNKNLVAAYWNELHALADQYGVELRFTASAGGGIPWLFNLRRQSRSDEILAISGIVNGTCNYILDTMHNEPVDFTEILAKAQALGYAEKDPTADICGFDTQRKCVISTNLAFGLSITEDEVPVFGIQNINAGDIKYFRQHSYTCKLLMNAGLKEHGAYASVEPTLVGKGAPEESAPANNNLISLTGNHIGTLSFYGQGAGKFPTGTSVIQDVLDIESGWGFKAADSKKINVTIDNAIESHRYYVRENGERRITEPMSVAAAHEIAAKSSDDSFFMAGIRE